MAFMAQVVGKKKKKKILHMELSAHEYYKKITSVVKDFT